MSLQRLARPTFTAKDVAGVNRLLQELAGTLVAAWDKLVANASLDYVEQANVVLNGAADTTVSHKLGRAIQGWSITDINAAATVYRVSSSATAIVLHASAACIVQLRVW